MGFVATDDEVDRYIESCCRAHMALKRGGVDTSIDGGSLMRVLIRIVQALTLALLLPTAVLAQATITGTVKDTSGAVLPGVTVEAASPALIEKVRTVVTDGSGQYRIVDLRPGDYSVTFAIPGFSTFKRDG